MNEFDRARREILAALLVEYHRTASELSDFDELKGRYPLTSRKEWFDPIISEIEHHLILTRTKDDVAARVHPRGYGAIVREVMENLDANILRIDPHKEEIISDATNYEWFPVPEGWKWLKEADEQSSGRPSAELQDAITAELLPASDRLVPLHHNSAFYGEIAAGLSSLHEELRSSNDLDCDPEERDRLLASLSAAQQLWGAAQLKAVQIKVGIILAIQDASKVLARVGKAVGAELLVDAIKSYVKTKTGMDI